VEIVGNLWFYLDDMDGVNESSTIQGLNVGEHTFYVEVGEGWTLVGEPDGSFNIDRCPSPPPEPPTGFFDEPAILPGLMMLIIGGAILIGRKFAFSS
jgi:hypothetical protein